MAISHEAEPVLTLTTALSLLAMIQHFQHFRKYNNMTLTNFTGIHFILYHYFLYDYSLTDILINYSLIMLFTLINNCSQDIGRSLANLHTVVFSLLQILCWLLLEAYGVSLVWSGQLGLTFLLLLDWVSSQSYFSWPSLVHIAV